MKLPINIAMSAVGATLFDADFAPMEVDVVTDTRLLQPGQTFLALRGERYDGHDFIVEAVERGATMLVVEQHDARVPGAATMIVDRTLSAYMQFARVARERFRGRVLAITGSAGKTTTKAFSAQLLSAVYGGRVAATPANENNEIGVSKLLLSLSNDEHDVAVVEMGARRFGDIAALVEIADPHVGILTNVGDAHVEIVGSRERLAETKWALFAKGASAVLNARDVVSLARSARLGMLPHWFFHGSEPMGRWRARTTALLGSTRVIDVDGDSIREFAVDTNLPGAHNRENAVAALAGALELGAPLEVLLEALSALQMPEGRFESFAMSGGWRIIYDAYNANAVGTLAALDAFAAERPQRAIAVLASMAELGEESERLHERVGAHAAGSVDLLLVGGEYADALARGAEGAGFARERIVPFASNTDAASWLREHAREGDAVLLKGSRKYKLEEILEEMRAP